MATDTNIATSGQGTWNMSARSHWKEVISQAPRAELEQALLRVAIPFVAMCVLLGIWLWNSRLTTDQLHGLLIAVVFLSCSLCLTAHILVIRDRTNVRVRRILGIIADNAVNSYFMLVMDEGGALVFGVYLFVTFGNGFRYGRFYLHLSQAFSLLGFTIVLYYSDYWSNQLSVGIGVLVAMIVLPFYVGVLAQRITEAKKRADEANQAKSRFLANVSHEMRTPLNGVIAMADLLSETPLHDTQIEIVDTLATSAQLALTQVEDVLDAAKIEAGRVPIERKPFNLARLICETVKVVMPQARYKGLYLETQVAGDIDGLYLGDPHHLRQVILNLLSNAIKFTATGGVVIRANAVGNAEPPVFRIEVQDTGIGIPENKIGTIFEAFAQADDSITRVYGGTGLGTTIARQLVLLMNGQIGVTSSEGNGTTFWFEVPLARTHIAANDSELGVVADNIQLARVQAATGDVGGRKLRGARVLVAEDNATNQRVTELILSSRGHSATIVANGELALDALERGEFDIALFDLSMPVLSGLEALKAYRFVEPNPIPVLILSANVTRELIAECKAAGAADFVTKPVRASVLLDAIERQLAGTQVASEGKAPSSTHEESLDPGANTSGTPFDLGVIEELRRLSSDQQFVERLLLGFRSDCEKLTAEIAHALLNHDWFAAKDSAHALKGGSGGVGARLLLQFAIGLEKSTHDALKANANKLVAELHEATQATLSYIPSLTGAVRGKAARTSLGLVAPQFASSSDTGGNSDKPSKRRAY